MVSELFLAIQNKKPQINKCQMTGHEGAHYDPVTASGISFEEKESWRQRLCSQSKDAESGPAWLYKNVKESTTTTAFNPAETQRV
jgi:hypothetical protein